MLSIVLRLACRAVIAAMELLAGFGVAFGQGLVDVHERKPPETLICGSGILMCRVSVGDAPAANRTAQMPRGAGGCQFD